jgi:putative chitinase
MLTSDIMRHLWPSPDGRVGALIEGIVAAAPTVFARFGLESDLVIAHAMAQFSHECGAGRDMVENINYSPARACAVWPSRFSSEADCLAKVGCQAGDPRFPSKLMDLVYGNRMGNRPGTNDGSRYIGRGLSQVTGRESYQKLGDMVGLNLVDNPDLVTDPGNALLCAVADFILCGCLPFAKADDIQGVTKHLNGGFIGLSERTAWLGRWKVALGVQDSAPHGTVWVQQSLNRLGADPVLVPDGMFGPLTASALEAFQRTHGLPSDGRVTLETIAAIERALAG